MDEQDSPQSGSRWEPDTAPIAPVPPEDPPEDVADPTPPSRVKPLGRGVLGAAAGALLVVGGLGGFALGHATGGGTDRVGLVDNQFPGGEGPGARLVPPGGHLDADHDGDGPPGLPPGGDHDGDLDGDQGRDQSGGETGT
jgi:hypothetical protein